MSIRDNPVLTTLTGLASVGSVVHDFGIYGNPSLPTCAAAAVFAHTMVGAAVDITGDVPDACGG